MKSFILCSFLFLFSLICFSEEKNVDINNFCSDEVKKTCIKFTTSELDGLTLMGYDEKGISFAIGVKNMWVAKQLDQLIAALQHPSTFELGMIRYEKYSFKSSTENHDRNLLTWVSISYRPQIRD